jgi:two-component system, OmpR family, osmolarity sensor histidine kinase EnvZ
VSLLPKSLFARLFLLITLAVVVVVVALALIFRQDRVALIARNFTDAKVQQIEALRDALAKAPDERPQTIQAIARQYAVLIVPVERRPDIGKLPGPAFKRIVDKLQEQLGDDTEIRWGTRLDQAIVWIRMPIAGVDKARAVWVGFPMRNVDAGEFPVRLAIVLGGVALALLIGTLWFARRLTRPLSELSKAVATVAEGKHPNPLPENGPSEIAEVARNVNKMATNLAQLETDRRTMLAGISHDIRTPLARLRLASEISVADKKSRNDMNADIDDIDRIVTQFLDFARGEPSEPAQPMRVDEALAHIAQKAEALRMPVTWVSDEANAAHGAMIDVFPAAFERMLINLIENAHRYGKPPVEISALRDGGFIEITVIDHGEGVSAQDAERLKQPFVRGDAARGGHLGAGLGLAIVERLAKWHNGQFDIARRVGGGNAARVRLPIRDR